MTLKEFMKKWAGKPTDFDGIYPNQCMDLMHFYVYEVLGLKDKTILAAPSAKGVYQNFKWKTYFEKIDNTPNGIPEEGDIIFWGGGQWGHVAIFLKGDVNEFISFDANYPIGTLPHEQYHNYFNVLGWLRIKEKDSDDLAILQKEISVLEARLEASKHTEELLIKKINELDNNYVLLEEKYAKDNKVLADQRDKCQKDYANLKKTFQDVCDEHEETLKSLENEIIKLKKGDEVNKDMLKPIYEACKEPLRLLVLAVIPFALAYFGDLGYEWAAIVVLVLRGIDKFLHLTRTDKKTASGLTRF